MDRFCLAQSKLLNQQTENGTVQYPRIEAFEIEAKSTRWFRLGRLLARFFSEGLAITDEIFSIENIGQKTGIGL